MSGHGPAQKRSPAQVERAPLEPGSPSLKIQGQVRLKTDVSLSLQAVAVNPIVCAIPHKGALSALCVQPKRKVSYVYSQRERSATRAAVRHPKTTPLA